MTDREPGKLVDPPPPAPSQSVVAIHIKDGLFKKFILGLLCYFAYSAISNAIWNFKFFKQVVYWACALLLSFVGWDVKPPKEVMEQGQAFYQSIVQYLPAQFRPVHPDPSISDERDRLIVEAKKLKARLAAEAKERADKVAAEVELRAAKVREEAEARIEQVRHAAEQVADEAERKLSVVGRLARLAEGVSVLGMRLGSIRDGAQSLFANVSDRLPGWRSAAEELMSDKADEKQRQIASDKARRERARLVKNQRRAEANIIFRQIDDMWGREAQRILDNNARIEAAQRAQFNRAMSVRPGPVGVVVRKR